MTDESLNLPEREELKRDIACIMAGIDKSEHPLFLARAGALIDSLGDRIAAIALNRRTPQPNKAGVGGAVLSDAATSEAVSVLCGLTDEHRIDMDDGRMDYLCRIAREIASLATPPPPGAGEDRRDAERYRWLRDRAFKDAGNIAFEVVHGYDHFGISHEGINAAIDAAMRGEGNGKG